MSIYPPTGTLEIKDATLKIPVIDLQYTSNTAKIEANSNVVTEFQRSKKLIKYPRVALTQNDESGTSGYVASASTSVSTRGPYQAFDNVLYSSWHEPVYQSSPYPNTDGAYTGGSGTVYDTNGYQGEYLQIQLPGKIKLYNYSISNRPAAGIEGRQPKDAKIFASNDGNTWIDIHTHGDGGGTYDIAGETRSFQLDNITETHYKYYRLVINSIIQGGTSDTANISQWQLYGIPEYDPDADGVNVVVKSVPNVPNTDWLEVYYDAKDLEDGVVTSVDDLTPSGINDGTATNVTVSDGAFAFNGTSSLLESSTTITNSTGDIPHTFSLWVKPSGSDLDDTNNHYLIVYGTELNTGKWSGISISNKRFASAIHASVIRFGPEVRVGEWYHIVLNYKSGGIHNSERFDFFINGSQIDTTALSTAGSQAGSATLSLSSPAKLVLGGLFTGAERSSSTIANSRLFNRALTPDEVWQLYAYQKEYFGHGDLSMTLKAGRLGIGTSEPRAALDVRGDVYSGCPVFWFASSQSTSGFLNYNQVHVNKGGGIQGDKFIAPISGYYHMTLHHLGNTGTSQTHRLEWFLNGVEIGFDGIFGLYASTGGNAHYQNIAGSLIWYMNAGDYMQVYVHDNSTNGNFNGWSGFLLST